MQLIDRHASVAHPRPSEAQKIAGNYAKGHVKLHGLDISIENPRGSYREGVHNGRPWRVKMPAHYGYIRGSEGADGDHVDVYIGPHHKSGRVFVVDQIDARSKEFDEHKAMLGYSTAEQAKNAYRAAFSDGKGNDRIGSVTEMSIDHFKKWLRNGKTHKQMSAIPSFATGGRVPHMADGGVPTFDPSQPFEPVGAPATTDAPPFDPSKPFDAVTTPPQADTPSIAQRALKPITSLPGVYSGMVNEGVDTMSHGFQQVKNAFDPSQPGSAQGQLEALKGVGNMAYGGLQYLTAPFNAPLRAVVGQPVEDATGIPKEYTEFAASMLMPGMGGGTKVPTAPAAATARDMLAGASDRLGVPVPNIAASDSLTTQRAGSALKEVPIIGDPIVTASKNTMAGIGNAAQDVTAGYGSGSIFTAGDAAGTGLASWIKGGSSALADRLYSGVDPLIDPNVRRPLHATEKLVSDIMAQRSNAMIPGSSPAVQTVLDAVQSNGLNYQGVKDLRSFIGDKTQQQLVAEGINPKEAKQLYGALTEDLRGTVLDAGGADALAKFDKANSLYGQIVDKRENLAKIVGASGDATPERVFQRIMDMAGSRGGADMTTLIQARRAMGPEAWNEIASAAVSRMGIDPTTNQFSGDRFLTAYRKQLSDQGRNVLFRSTGNTNLAQSLDDIATVSERFKELSKYGNPSGTGRVATAASLVAAAFHSPLETAATAIGGNIMARALASPVTARNIANWSKAYVANQTVPSPFSVRNLNAASRGLSLALQRNFGADADQVFNGLQGMAPVRANQDQTQ